MSNKKIKYCKYCKKEIKGFWKIFKKYCNEECGYRYFKKIEREELKKRYRQLSNKHVKREKVISDIREKYIALKEYDDPKKMLLKLINEWKKIQDKKLKIINIDVWKIDSRFLDGCEPWQSKIYYTFDLGN